MDERNLDELIDQGLASYSAGPSDDLAARVLVEARATGVVPIRSTYKAWAGAGVGIAAAGLVAFLLMHPEGKPRRPSIVPGNTAAVMRPSRPAPVFASSPSGRKVAVYPRPHAGRRVYVPQPMTEQERLLQAFVVEHPKEALAFIALNEREFEPLKIEPIATTPLKIEPLQIDPPAD